MRGRTRDGRARVERERERERDSGGERSLRKEHLLYKQK